MTESFKLFAKSFFIACLFAVLFVSLTLVFTGYHNVDLSHNFMVMGERHDMQFEDRTLGDVVLTMQDGYILGHRFIFAGFFTLLWGYMSLSVLVLYSMIGGEENGRTHKPNTNTRK